LHDTYDINSIKIIKHKANRAEIQRLFFKLSKGNIDGRKIENLSNNAAEIILSSMNRSKYPEHSSLPKTLKSENFGL